MDIIDNIIQYFKSENNKEDLISPEGTCPVCWGRQEYDGKIRTLIKDKQIDINNHQDSYMIIQEFMNHNSNGIVLQKGIVSDCPECSSEIERK